MESILSVDVEDWFHILDIPSAPALADWDRLPSRVESNFMRLLDLFDRKSARVTCFILGWVAQRFPHLVKEAAAGGHEIASHGFAHRLAYQMSPAEFREDAVRSRKLLEDLTGAPVLGYRAAGFSVVAQVPWFFEELKAAGYIYDSSVFPARRGHGGMRNAQRSPYVIGNGLVEFPVSVVDVLGTPVCFFGGGYLRLFPYWLVRSMSRNVLTAGRPVLFYVHPREIDPEHPRLPMGLWRRFKSYVNLRQTEEKLSRLLDDFPVTTFQEYLSRNGLSADRLSRAAMPAD